MLTGHGGNYHYWASVLGCSPDEIIDMSSNVNPLGPMDGLVAWLRNRMEIIGALPEADASAVIRRFGARYGIDPSNVLVGNGTTHFIYAIPGILDCRKVLIFGPTYSDYADAFLLKGAEVVHRIATPETDFCHSLDDLDAEERDCDTIVICNPNNPTGNLIFRDALENFCRRNGQRTIVVDESYLPFSDAEETCTLLGSDLQNVVVLHSMSKIFRIPGLRIGFAVSANPKLIRRFRQAQQPWCVNALAQEAACFLLDPQCPTDAFIAETRRFFDEEKRTMVEILSEETGLRVFPSATSFLLIRLPEGLAASVVVEETVRTHRILLRDCSNFHGLDSRFVRVSLKTSEVNRLVARWLCHLAGNVAGNGHRCSIPPPDCRLGISD